MQLTEDEALADKAYRCAASIHRHQQLLPVFTTTAHDCKDNEEQSDYSVASVGSCRGDCSSQRSRRGQNRPKDGRGGQTPQYSSSSSQPDTAGQAGWSLMQPLHVQ